MFAFQIELRIWSPNESRGKLCQIMDFFLLILSFSALVLLNMYEIQAVSTQSS